MPAVPAELLERLNRYQNTRGASLAGWTRDGCLLVSTRFAETAQAHRVCEPLGMREQLTFHPEPVTGLVPATFTPMYDDGSLNLAQVDLGLIAPEAGAGGQTFEMAHGNGRSFEPSQPQQDGARRSAALAVSDGTSREHPAGATNRILDAYA